MYDKTKGKNRVPNLILKKKIVYIDPHLLIIHRVPNLILNFCSHNTNIKESTEKPFTGST
jgi:hypothetical protein